jgi:hypothetical protein
VKEARAAEKAAETARGEGGDCKAAAKTARAVKKAVREVPVGDAAVYYAQSPLDAEKKAKVLARGGLPHYIRSHGVSLLGDLDMRRQAAQAHCRGRGRERGRERESSHRRKEDAQTQN